MDRINKQWTNNLPKYLMLRLLSMVLAFYLTGCASVTVISPLENVEELENVTINLKNNESIKTEKVSIRAGEIKYGESLDQTINYTQVKDLIVLDRYKGFYTAARIMALIVTLPELYFVLPGPPSPSPTPVFEWIAYVTYRGFAGAGVGGLTGIVFGYEDIYVFEPQTPVD